MNVAMWAWTPLCLALSLAGLTGSSQAQTRAVPGAATPALSTAREVPPDPVSDILSTEPIKPVAAKAPAPTPPVPPTLQKSAPVMPAPVMPVQSVKGPDKVSIKAPAALRTTGSAAGQGAEAGAAKRATRPEAVAGPRKGQDRAEVKTASKVQPRVPESGQRIADPQVRERALETTAGQRRPQPQMVSRETRGASAKPAASTDSARPAKKVGKPVARAPVPAQAPARNPGKVPRKLQGGVSAQGPVKASAKSSIKPQRKSSVVPATAQPKSTRRTPSSR